jgi:ElaB/YqjD/DUF883 family membrane-anchored ribosome-binding protein
MSNSARRAAKDFNNVADEAKDAMKETAGDLLESARKVGVHAREVVQDHWDDVRTTAADYVEQGRDKARQMGKQVEGRIQESPMKSLLIALGVGFLVGLFMKRR